MTPCSLPNYLNTGRQTVTAENDFDDMIKLKTRNSRTKVLKYPSQ